MFLSSFSISVVCLVLIHAHEEEIVEYQIRNWEFKLLRDYDIFHKSSDLEKNIQ